MSKAPPTPGYDPHLVLARFFFGKSDISEEEMTKTKSVIGFVTEHRSHPEGSTLISRFNQCVADHRGVGSLIISLHEAELAEGLLECLNPYQSYSPFTAPESVTLQSRGVYDHFKGGVYMIRDFSTWASGNGEKVVEYLSMLFGTKASRLMSQWCEVVRWPDGKYRSRFVYRGPDLRTPEPSFKVPSPLHPPA
jgi:hypothetical protein